MAISKRAWKGGAIAIAVVAVLFVGGLYSGLFAAAFPKPVPAPTGQGLWESTITAGTVATAAETAVISLDGKTVDLYSGLADWQSVADNDNIVLTFDLENRNTGSSEISYVADGAIAFVPQPAGGAGTTFIVLRDGNGLWDVDYAGYASGSEPRDELRVVVASLAIDSGITVTMEAAEVGFDNFQSSGNYALTFVIGGQTLTMAFHVTGA